MANVLRLGSGRLKSSDFVQKKQSGVSQLIANEFWNYSANEGKKISVTLKNSAGALVANTDVKYAVFEFDNAIPFNLNFMQVVSKGVYTTDASGNFVINYIGSSDIGGYAYLAILHPHSSPTESVIWKVTIS
jgi:hypothetical protein